MAEQDPTRISGVALQAFRGVVTGLDLPLAGDGRARSALLLGPNGSGKSSVVDGIEFALQGRVGGRPNDDPAAPTLRCMHAPAEAESIATVVLSSGEHVTRANAARDSGEDAEPHPAFASSRFVIRRRDITDFSTMAQRDRPPMLLQYLRMQRRSNGIDGLAPEVLALHEERDALRSAKSALEDQLVQAWGLAPGQVPRTPAQLDALVAQHRGITKQEARRQGKARPRLTGKPGELVRAINDHYNQLRENSRRRNELNDGRLFRDLRAELEMISEKVTGAFLRISPQRAVIQDLNFFESREDRGVELRVRLTNGYATTPAKVLSEASLDLLALLTYIHLTAVSIRHGQARVLVLDDTFSSVDAAVRQDFAEYLFDEFADWQLILAFHDLLWFEQFKRAALAARHDFVAHEFGPWRGGAGPSVYGLPVHAAPALRAALADLRHTTKVEVAAATGLLLETVLDQMSVTLAVPLPRRTAGNYTIGQLWDPVRQALDRLGLVSVTAELNAVLHYRNLIGAHYNEWAQSVDPDEVARFTERTLALYDSVFCQSCGHYVRVRAGKPAGCRCRKGGLVLA